MRGRYRLARTVLARSGGLGVIADLQRMQAEIATRQLDLQRDQLEFERQKTDFAREIEMPMARESIMESRARRTERGQVRTWGMAVVSVVVASALVIIFLTVAETARLRWA